MEPLDDDDLNRLLRQWEAPAPPARLRPTPRAPWWRWFVEGSIRIPVPVGIVAVLVAAALWWFHGAAMQTAAPAPAPVVSFADFQPVKEVIPRTVE